MKKFISIIAVGLMVFSLAACAGKKDAETEAPESESTAPVETETSEETEPADDGQNPVMNFIGDYYLDRASMNISASGENGAAIFVTWSSSAFEHSEWTMMGEFNEDTMSIEYKDCEKKTIVFKENGEIESETVEYSDGTGRIVFGDGNTLTWEDDKANIADGAVFHSEHLQDPMRKEILSFL